MLFLASEQDISCARQTPHKWAELSERPSSAYVLVICTSAHVSALNGTTPRKSVNNTNGRPQRHILCFDGQGRCALCEICLTFFVASNRLDEEELNHRGGLQTT